MRTVTLRKGGITLKDIPENEVSLKLRAGYVKVEEPEEIQAPEAENEGGDPSSEIGPASVSIDQIYAMCEEASVSPDDLKINSENPTLTQVKAAVTKAKKAAGK